MATILAFDARRPRGGPRRPAPPKNPAEIWINSRKPGRSRTSAAQQLDVAARLLGYGRPEGEAGGWRECPWWMLGYVQIASLRTTLQDKVAEGVYTAAYANNILKAAKFVMREAWRLSVDLDEAEKYLTAEQWLVIQDIAKVSGKRLRRPRRALTAEEFDALIKHCAADPTPRGKRDAALFALAKDCGLRQSEFVALTVADYDRASRRLRVPMTKTDAEEDVWLTLKYPATAVYLDAWLAVRGKIPGAFFTRLERGGVGVIQTLFFNAINKIMQRRGEEVGITDFSSHATRRGCGTLTILETGNPAIAQKRLRHAKLDTTLDAYWEPTEAQLREATEKAQAAQRPGVTS